MRKILLSIGALVFASVAFAQQNFQVSQYYKASNLINPAFSGVNTTMELSMGYRKQWAGFERSPRTFYIAGHQGIQNTHISSSSVSAPLHLSNTTETDNIKLESYKTGNQQGIGAYAYSDKFGYLNRTSFGATYAMHFSLTDDVALSGGVGLGMSNFALDFNALTINESNDAFFNALSATDNKQMSADLAIGMLVYSKYWYVGYSGLQLMGNKIFDSSVSSTGKLDVNHNIMAGYKYEIDKKMYIMTNVLFKLQGVGSAKVDFDVKCVKDNKYWAGLGFRNQDALVVFLGGQLTDNFNLNYSYDLNSRISKYTSGGHEIVIGISLGDKVGAKDNYYW